MSRLKTTKGITLPHVEKPKDKPKTLPFNGKAVTEKSFSFSFACFDRSHELFNLGNKKHGETVRGGWFIALLDCLKSMNNMDVTSMKTSLHDLHPIDWSKTNVTAPDGGNQRAYWQFRINKSKGRVIGFLIDGVFYIVWLDPYHNLTNSAGYGKATYYQSGLSDYEKLEEEYKRLKQENETLRCDLKAAEELLNG